MAYPSNFALPPSTHIEKYFVLVLKHVKIGYTSSIAWSLSEGTTIHFNNQLTTFFKSFFQFSFLSSHEQGKLRSCPCIGYYYSILGFSSKF